jgi:GMP synthase-like glutamine amidotransferase
VASGSLLGVQFHPERSGTDGLRLLANFVAIAGAAGGPGPVAARARTSGAFA